MPTHALRTRRAGGFGWLIFRLLVEGARAVADLRRDDIVALALIAPVVYRLMVRPTWRAVRRRRRDGRGMFGVGDGSVVWRKSSRSFLSGDCVEVASVGEVIAMRDSKNPTGPVLIFCADKWDAFVAGFKDGEFDHVWLRRARPVRIQEPASGEADGQEQR